MTTNDKQVIQLLRRSIFPKYNQCYKPKCSNKLSKKSIKATNHFLKKIARLNKIVILKSDDGDDYSFNNRVTDSVTFTPFSYLCHSCYKAYHKYAQPIDRLEDYKTQLWWTWSEFMKLCFNLYYKIEWYKAIIESPQINKDAKEIYRNKFYAATIQHSACQFIKQKIKSDLERNTKHFNFTCLELPYVEVLAKSAFMIPIPVIFTGNFMEEIDQQKQIQPLQSFNMILLFPKAKAWHAMIGTDNIESLIGKMNININNYTEHQKMKYMNDLLIKYIDKWIVSEALYKLWKQEAITYEVINQKMKYNEDEMKLREVNYNIFYGKI